MSQLKENDFEVNSLLPIDEGTKKEDAPIVEGEVKDTPEPDENFDFEDPATVQTRHNFVTSPLSKLAFVGGTFGAGFLVVFLVINAFTSVNMANKKTAIASKGFTDVKPPQDDQGEQAVGRVALIEQKNELDAINKHEHGSKLKFSKQVDKSELSQNKQNYTTVPISKYPNSSSLPPQSPTYNQTPSTRTTSYSPPTRSNKEYLPKVYSRNKQLLSSRSNGFSAPPPPPPESNNQAIAPTASSAMAEIDRLRTLGSIGRVEYKQASTKVPNSIAPRAKNNEEGIVNSEETLVSDNSLRNFDNSPNDSPSFQPRTSTRRKINNFTNQNSSSNNIEQLAPRWQPSSKEPEPGLNDEREYASNNTRNEESVSRVRLPVEAGKIASVGDTGLRDSLQLPENFSERPRNEDSLPPSSTLEEEKLILQETEPQYLVIGSFAKATLVTPLLSSSSKSESSSSQQADPLKFVAVLDEPLYSNTGKIAIPAKTQLIIVVSSVSPSSRVFAEVVAIIKDRTEYPINSGVMSVLGQSGEPLVASPFDDRGNEIAKNDLVLSSVAGLAKVGEIINKPDREITDQSIDSGITRTTSTNRHRNIEAAFGEGIFGKLTETIGKRTETSEKELASRPVDWIVPKNTKVTIEINKSIKL